MRHAEFSGAMGVRPSMLEAAIPGVLALFFAPVLLIPLLIFKPLGALFLALNLVA